MITAEKIIAFGRVANALFQKMYRGILQNTPMAGLAKLAMEVPSTQDSEEYPWLGAVPGLADFVDEIQISELNDYEFAIKNKDFGRAISVHRNALEDDKMGMIRPQIQMLAQRAILHRHKLIHSLIENGVTGLAYDGSAFFANRSVNDNLLAGTGITLSQLETDLDSARQAMMQFKDDQGETLGVIGNVVVCGPALERKFRTIMKSTADPAESNSGTYNPFSELLSDIIVDPELTDANDWYLAAVMGDLKPFAFQLRRGFETWTDDKDLKQKKRLLFGVDYRGNAGYLLPQLMTKTVNT